MLTKTIFVRTTASSHTGAVLLLSSGRRNDRDESSSNHLLHPVREARSGGENRDKLRGGYRAGVKLGSGARDDIGEAAHDHCKQPMNSVVLRLAVRQRLKASVSGVSRCRLA